MTMIIANIHEVKAKLSEYLDAVERGERVMICRRNQPVAELRAVEQKRTTPRPLGLAKGKIKILPSFFDPMPNDWLDEFYNGPVFPDAGNPSRVAESSSKYGAPRPTKRRQR